MALLPDDLAELDRALDNGLGADLAARVVAGWQVQRTPSFRVNTLKSDAKALIAELTAAGIPVTADPLSPWSFTTTPAGERDLKRSAAFTDGRLYCQSLTSQVAALIGDLTGGAILDACAAPGGKTTLLAMRAGPSVPLQAVERSAVRAQQLRHTLQRQGATWVEQLTADSRSLPAFLRKRRYAHILVDAPCTGSGTLRLHDRRTWEHLAGRYAGYVAIKAQQQLGILQSVAPLATAGGRIVYSTCSVDPHENEAVVEGLLKTHRGLDLEDLTAWGRFFPSAVPAVGDVAGRRVDERIPARCLRLLPDERSEGFFVAAFRVASASQKV